MFTWPRSASTARSLSASGPATDPKAACRAGKVTLNPRAELWCPRRRKTSVTEPLENLATESDPRALVGQLATREQRWPAFKALDALGARAIPALLEGLRDDHWDVRRWCLAVLGHNGGPEVRPSVLPLLHDRKSKVRLWAVHTLACDRCMAGANPVDAVPHLIERLWQDESEHPSAAHGFRDALDAAARR